MFRHILIPLDGSLQAERALPLAARLARASDGMLILVRAIAALPETGTESHLFQTAVQEEREEAQRYLTHIASSHQVAGLPVVVSVHQRPVVAAIQAAIDTYRTDLIVSCGLMNSLGPSSFFATLAGQISQRFSVPLLLLPAQEQQAHRFLAENRQPLTALVAFAGSQPEPFLIAPAAALLAALTTQMPGHLHFTPICLVQARLARTSVQQPPVGLQRGHHDVPSCNAVRVKEAPLAEKHANDEGYETTDVLVLETPLLREDEPLSRIVHAYPCLLVPSQVRGNAEHAPV